MSRKFSRSQLKGSSYLNTQAFLQEDGVFNLSDPEIGRFIDKHCSVITDLKRSAVELYLAVRDGIQYNPFNINLEFKDYSSSNVLAQKQGHCIDKAVLLITCYRSIGIPARLGLARVTNHIGTSKLERILKTNVLVPHGFVEVYLNEKWVKCTPAFNDTLCQKLGLAPLEFDGESDSIFQPYDEARNKCMEYLEYLGSFATLPVEEIKYWMGQEYPHMFNDEGLWLNDKMA